MIILLLIATIAVVIALATPLHILAGICAGGLVLFPVLLLAALSAGARMADAIGFAGDLSLVAGMALAAYLDNG